ncbi:MAG TPA: fibrillarin-like rRNA/tRNA 2'-O-methyltransferase [Euryarchaeota archaeon]|nr:fibrillarin [archaeon BMS3Bbin15]HDL15136.1 fibrillarin-like rRNA/tRNA 2'-O-methyltransferase [Euryarchaeota archaeon]
MKKKFKGITEVKGGIATLNLTPGRRVYGEKLVTLDEKEFRMWNPRRSKLAAAIYKGLKYMPLNKSSKVLYLGAAQGTTASHISDIAVKGIIYCIEISPHALRKLLEVCTFRSNMVPVLGDASQPQDYLHLLEKVDIIYQDIAQPNQTEILIRNSEFLLRDNGYVMLTIKAASIDTLVDSEKIFVREIKKLRKAGFNVLQDIRLSPYEKEHAFVIAEKK